MNNLPRKYSFINLIFLLTLTLLLHSEVRAQYSFLYKGNSLTSYYVLEDGMGGFIGLTYDKILRINPQGRLLWERLNYGFTYKGFHIRDSHNYVFSGASSEFGGFGMMAFDCRGKKIWEKFMSSEPEARSIYDIIHDSVRGQYIVAGAKYKVSVENKSQYWVAGVDYAGNILWENFWWDTGQSKYFTKIFKNNQTKGYLLLSNDHSKSRTATELVHVDSLGKTININWIEPEPCEIDPQYDNYRLKDIASYNDSFLIATVAVRTSCNDLNGSFFYIYDANGKLMNRIKSDWAWDIVKQTRDKGILVSSGISYAKLNKNFDLEWSQMIHGLTSWPNSIEIDEINQSADGGYFGIASGSDNRGLWPDSWHLIIFKTDSMGKIKPTEEYSEKKEPMMLQPNPAQNKVRIAIPYYYGSIYARFYDMHGVLVFEKTQDEEVPFDISSLTSGMYIVKARIEETGETRTMKLVVN